MINEVFPFLLFSTRVPLADKKSRSWKMLKFISSLLYNKKGKQVVGLERGPLSLVSTTEELLDKK
jgi:hypothetical protein